MKRDLPSLDDCVHCGLCLPACPTYAIDRREIQNPRGRIAALRQIDEAVAGDEEAESVRHSPALLRGLDDCLVCRACESACPAGISMETLMAEHRASTPRPKGLPAQLERWLLDEILPSPPRVQIFGALTRLTRSLLRAVPGTDLPRKTRLARPRALPADGWSPNGEPRGTVKLMRGCIADAWFRRETEAAGRLLAHLGWRVLLDDAGCCGALHRHAGDLEAARTLESARIESLTAGKPDAILIDSAGCLASLLEPLRRESRRRTEGITVTDPPAWLATIDLPDPPTPISGPVAFFPPCHQEHGSGTTAATRRLLERITDGPVLDLPGASFCCGAAGTYGLRRPEKSRAIGAAARERWEQAGSPPILATGNPGCLLRWETLLPDEVRVVSPTQLAAEAFGGL